MDQGRVCGGYTVQWPKHSECFGAIADALGAVNRTLAAKGEENGQSFQAAIELLVRAVLAWKKSPEFPHSTGKMIRQIANY
ncbi:hypothetical protein [Saezia sanguinis]|uniref:hypothetical protein n=1 Tax=Saezia sanguinis TaxID=1965230 RepID=UPI0030D755E5